jgi:transketolase
MHRVQGANGVRNDCKPKPRPDASRAPEIEPAMMTTGLPNLEEFANTLLGLAQADRSVIAITSDSRGSGKLTRFGETVPGQMIEVGIAEQNLVAIAAGLASAGKKVFAVSPACFLTARALEQIKNDVAYSDHPVKIIGISAGVSYGALGSTHHSLHDLAALRAIPNIDLVVPADNFETRQAVRAAMNHPRPVYIRFGKRPAPNLHGPNAAFQIGKAMPLSTGKDVTFIATGETVSHAVRASTVLEQESVSCGVISVHSVKPLDRDLLLKTARETRAVITVEEHSVHGGLGEACASLLMEEGISLPFRRAGIPDEYPATGSQEEIFQHYGISAHGLAEAARRLLRG